MNDKNISKRIITSATMAAAIAAGTASNAVQVFASDTGDPVDDPNAALQQAQDEYDSLKEKADFITDEDRANAENTVTEATKAADDAKLAEEKTKIEADNAETEKNTAQTNADNASAAVDVNKVVTDKTNDVTNEENGKATEANARAALDDLVNTLNRRDELEKEINDLNEAIPGYEKDAKNLSAQSDTSKATEISVNTDGTMSFRSNADLTKLKGVQVDGKDADPSQYTLSKGSTVVNLKKSSVDSLGKSSHTITIISEDDSASTSFELNDKGASIVGDQTSADNTAPETKTSESTRITSDSTQAYVTSTPGTSDVTESAPWVFMVVVSLVTAGGVVYLKHSHE